VADWELLLLPSIVREYCDIYHESGRGSKFKI
jgi:hypothetical protein